MKPMKSMGPMNGAVKRFMKTDIVEDEDGPMYEVTVNGEGGQPSMPMQGGMQGMEMGGGAISEDEMRQMFEDAKAGMRMHGRGDDPGPMGMMEQGGFGGDPDEAPVELDSLSPDAQRVYEEQLEADGDPTTIELVREGLTKAEAQRVIDLLMQGGDEPEGGHAHGG